MRQCLNLPAPALMALLYLSWITVGALLLMLPVASTDGITWSDAFFTATSAVTVTGLVVVDTGTAFTTFGQGVLMLLIQLGGMGLMTFAVLVLSSLGMQIGLAQLQFLREEMGLASLGGLLNIVWVVFRVVLVCELIGMAIMAFVFVPEFGWREGLWLAAFHSISAFNNAGFSLFSNSLMEYVDSPLIIFTISVQFIVAGLGFAVLSDILVYGKWQKFSLHTRLMLVGTLSLILISCLGYGILEWNNPETLGSLASPGERMNAIWFEAVTPRTAGFNAMNTAAMQDSTTLMTMVLMVIGGGSTSTAGGIKVTTAVVLLLATIAFFRNSGRMKAFGYSVGLQQGLKVMALLTISLFVVLTGLFLIVATHEIDFLTAAFEVTSAFGTVGLSQGATGELNDFGRAIICLIMFLGRLGPLTLGFFLASKTKPRIQYPEGTIYLG
ncbi:trk system potassium uptake protein TrkH [Litorimonas taeanensis]|uniref:Trk system potassium uptake protein TrkH n=1 Tax=Litorimonas taeanensis TaxID=568099 RepID=A0A420WJI5_9PROT|nr:potassium transporter TrkG [Litorimonas taeanensis]RKQ71191.1 trk system potassium uptake protein TrkH [Litorimonas taeanensis]